MNRKKIIVVGGAVLVFAAVSWFVVKPKFIDSKPAPSYSDEQLAEAPRPTLTLEERVLNLKSPAGAPNYVKAVIALEFEDPNHKWIGLKGEPLAKKNEEFSKEMEPALHRIWDVITDVIGARSVDEVSTPVGREVLKAELLEAINHELHGEKVEGIFFATFITQ